MIIRVNRWGFHCQIIWQKNRLNLEKRGTYEEVAIDPGDYPGAGLPDCLWAFSGRAGGHHDGDRRKCILDANGSGADRDQDPDVTPTPTLTPTPTNTPTPSRTPTLTLEPPPDNSWARLTLDDLPPGFTEIPSDDFLAAMGEVGEESLVFEDAYIFLDIERFHILMGFTVLITSQGEQAGFDLILRQPDIMAELFVIGLEEEGEDEILSQEAIADTEGLGDAANHFRIVADMDGTPMLMDVLIFRQGSAGVILILMYEDGDVSAVDVVELGSLIESRGPE